MKQTSQFVTLSRKACHHFRASAPNRMTTPNNATSRGANVKAFRSLLTSLAACRPRGAPPGPPRGGPGHLKPLPERGPQPFWSARQIKEARRLESYWREAVWIGPLWPRAAKTQTFQESPRAYKGEGTANTHTHTHTHSTHTHQKENKNTNKQTHTGLGTNMIR